MGPGLSEEWKEVGMGFWRRTGVRGLPHLGSGGNRGVILAPQEHHKHTSIGRKEVQKKAAVARSTLQKKKSEIRLPRAAPGPQLLPHSHSPLDVAPWGQPL